MNVGEMAAKVVGVVNANNLTVIEALAVVANANKDKLDAALHGHNGILLPSGSTFVTTRWYALLVQFNLIPLLWMIISTV